MKRITVFAIGLLASLASAGSASAQDHAEKATIPFGFYVANTWLPAGTYTITSDAPLTDFIAVQNADKRTVMMSLVQPESQPSTVNRLVFSKYGDQYFLRRVEGTSPGINVSLSVSKREKKAQTSERAAVAAPSNDQLASAEVYIALN